MTNNNNAVLRYIMLSTSHLSQADALTLAYLSDPLDSADKFTPEWIHNTGMHNGYLIRLSARDDAWVNSDCWAFLTRCAQPSHY